MERGSNNYYSIIQGGYFDFKGSDSLIKICKRHIGNTYGIVDILKKDEYKRAIDELVAFRNYAAHNSKSAKEKAKTVLGRKRIPPIGSYLKMHKKAEEIADRLYDFAEEIEKATK